LSPASNKNLWAVESGFLISDENQVQVWETPAGKLFDIEYFSGNGGFQKKKKTGTPGPSPHKAATARAIMGSPRAHP